MYNKYFLFFVILMYIIGSVISKPDGFPHEIEEVYRYEVIFFIDMLN